jgi:hypothetical protein
MLPPVFVLRPRIIEKDHDAVARELVERALELADEWPQRTVIFAQKVEDFLRLGGLGEGGVAAQVAKHDDDLTAMRFEDLVFARPESDRRDQVGRYIIG